MAMPLKELDAVLTDLDDLAAYVTKRPYYDRARVADKVQGIAAALNALASGHTWIDGYRREANPRPPAYLEAAE